VLPEPSPPTSRAKVGLDGPPYHPSCKVFFRTNQSSAAPAPLGPWLGRLAILCGPPRLLVSREDLVRSAAPARISSGRYQIVS
jgi:hypothetical protein